MQPGRRGGHGWDGRQALGRPSHGRATGSRIDLVGAVQPDVHEHREHDQARERAADTGPAERLFPQWKSIHRISTRVYSVPLPPTPSRPPATFWGRPVAA